MKLQMRATVGGVILVLCLSLRTGVAGATHVGCGLVITQNTTLDSDIGPCAGNGIVIGANDITLDLGGHRVLGTGSGTGIYTNSRSRVRVTNGTVAGFSVGVHAFQGNTVAPGGQDTDAQITVERLIVRDNRSTGVIVNLNSGNRVRLNVVTGNGWGEVAFGFAAGGGIATAASHGNVIESNFVSRNGGPGIALGTGSVSRFGGLNTLLGNSISANRGDGVVLAGGLRGSSGNRVLGNAIATNRGNGVLVEGGNLCCNVIQSNVIRANLANGVLLHRHGVIPGPSLPDGILNHDVVTNTAVDNRLFDLADENPGCGNNTWAGNTYGTRNQPCIN